jgi:hypothetical protein
MFGVRRVEAFAAGVSLRGSPIFFLLLLIVSAMTLSCAGDAAFKKACAAIDRTQGFEKLISDLVRIDQEFPDRFQLKHEIGMLCLEKGDPGSAAPYLQRAYVLAGNRIKGPEKATLFGGLAIVSYSRGDYANAVEYGRKALSVKVDEAAPFGFITGRALLAEGRQKDALQYFDAAWASARPSMSMEDYRAYARSLESAGRHADLVAVLDSYEGLYPYEPGLGLMQSAAYERLGELDAAVLSAFKEAEYGNAYGASRPADIQNNLAALGRKLDDKTFNPAGKGKTALGAVTSFARRDWIAAVRLLEKRRGTGAFERYLFLSSLIEMKQAASADMDAYAALLPHLRSLPPYFYRLYLGLKGLPNQSSDRMADLLETAINLAPRSESSGSYRKELAMVLGLPQSESSRLLTTAELSAAADKAAGTGESALLEPLIATLELKDNRTTLFAVGILRAFAKDARYRSFFIDKSKAAAGRTKERLAYILAN